LVTLHRMNSTRMFIAKAGSSTAQCSSSHYILATILAILSRMAFLDDKR